MKTKAEGKHHFGRENFSLSLSLSLIEGRERVKRRVMYGEREREDKESTFNNMCTRTNKFPLPSSQHSSLSLSLSLSLRGQELNENEMKNTYLLFSSSS